MKKNTMKHSRTRLHTGLCIAAFTALAISTGAGASSSGSFSDYLKEADPELYQAIQDQYNSIKEEYESNGGASYYATHPLGSSSDSYSSGSGGSSYGSYSSGSGGSSYGSYSSGSSGRSSRSYSSRSSSGNSHSSDAKEDAVAETETEPATEAVTEEVTEAGYAGVCFQEASKMAEADDCVDEVSLIERLERDAFVIYAYQIGADQSEASERFRSYQTVLSKDCGFELQSDLTGSVIVLDEEQDLTAYLSTVQMEDGSFDLMVVLPKSDATEEECATAASQAVLDLGKAADYQSALDYMEKENYKKAKEIFTELGSYSDSQDQLKECSYQLGIQSFKAKRYQAALDMLGTVASYKDASTLMGICKDALSSAAYEAAVELYCSGEYDKASEAFSALGNYANAKEMAQYTAGDAKKPGQYAEAVELYCSGDYEAAKEAFTALGDYANSAQMVKEVEARISLGEGAQNGAAYEAAVELYRTGEYDKAVEAFKALGDYANATEMAAYIADEAPKPGQYAQAVDLYLGGEYDAAKEAFTALGDYANSAQMEKECVYQKAQILLADGQAEDANALFLELGDYRDAADILNRQAYDAASALQDSGDLKGALSAFRELGSYSDAAERAEQLIEQNPFLDLQVGDEFTLGAYEGYDTQWIVIALEEGRALLLSKYALEKMSFNPDSVDRESPEPVTWENSEIRRWLNEDFLHLAFSAGERSLIFESDNENRALEDATETGNNTKDRVFLLSEEEAEKYLSGSSYVTAGVEYNIEKTWTDNTDHHDVSCSWWLRTMTGHNDAAVVDFNGQIGDEIYGGVTQDFYVRPAVWIDVSLDADTLNPLLADTARSEAPYNYLDDVKDFSEAQVGDRVRMGSWQGEDIVWRVLDRKDDVLTVISEFVLDLQLYNEEHALVDFGSSSIRTWMNDTFFNAAFTSEEQSCIAADQSPTGDRLFLLDKEQAASYFKSRTQRTARPTPYALSQGLFADDYGRSSWWLRDTYDNKNGHGPASCAFIVYRTGEISSQVFVDGGNSPSGYGVRPAMCVRADLAAATEPAGTEETAAAEADENAGEAAVEEQAAQAEVDLSAAETVRKVQEALNNAGYDCGTPDGAAGQKTAEAITNYQRDHGLEETGRIDMALVESLNL